jgi:hypothetical protein
VAQRFLAEYEAAEVLGTSILSRRARALTKAPCDKKCFLPIIRECLHLMPEKRISFLKLIQQFTDLGPKEEIYRARNEILSILKCINN